MGLTPGARRQYGKWQREIQKILKTRQLFTIVEFDHVDGLTARSGLYHAARKLEAVISLLSHGKQSIKVMLVYPPAREASPADRLLAIGEDPGLQREYVNERTRNLDVRADSAGIE